MKRHLIYIDITQICNVGCDFCMYKNERKNGLSLALNAIGQQNIKNIINANNIYRIVISAEGEPLNNENMIFEILSYLHSDNEIEIITSAYKSPEELNNIFTKINSMFNHKKVKCDIRISLDSFHYQNVSKKVYEYIIGIIAKQSFSNLNFSFRSIDTDKEFISSFMMNMQKLLDLKIVKIKEDILKDIFKINKEIVKVEYKNIIKPREVNVKDPLSIYQYIEDKSLQNEREFTLGNNLKGVHKAGLDITIKPNGDIKFYGIEIENIGNINKETFTIDKIEKICEDNELINFLCNYPMKSLLQKISKDIKLKSIIEYVNNPYWIIKEMAKVGIDAKYLLQFRD